MTKVNETLKKTMLLLATALWLLHSVVPHVHRVSENGYTAVGEVNPYHFLQVLFSVDLGEDHLEHVTDPGPLQVAAAPAPLPELVWTVGTAHIEEIGCVAAPPKQGCLFTRPQRGPPSV